MPSFLNLPEEIHRQILSYLLSNEDIAALSIQCRLLHGRCEMDLRKKSHQISISSRKTSIENAFSLLMQILKWPVLGHYVRTIVCCEAPPSDEDCPMTGHQRELSDREMQLLSAATRRAGFAGEKEDRVLSMLVQKTVEGDGGVLASDGRKAQGVFIAQALAALLITVSPNLVSLRLAQPFFNWNQTYLYDDQEADHTGPPGSVQKVDFPLASLLHGTNIDPEGKPYLQNLRSVYVIPTGNEVHNWFYQEFEFKGVLALLNRLPTIESIGTELLEDNVNLPPGLTLDPCNFSRIDIQHASVDSTYLAGLIASCETLREFRYAVGGRTSYSERYAVFNPKAFLKALCTHKETLEVLDIDVSACQFDLFFRRDESEQSLDGIGGPLMPTPPRVCKFLKSIWKNGGSLQDFVSLKRLSLGIGFLLYFARGLSEYADDYDPGEWPIVWDANDRREWPMLADCLPGNLEHLCIRGYQVGANEEHDIQIDAPIDYFESGLSSLKEIEGVEEVIPHARNAKYPDPYNSDEDDPDYYSYEETYLEDSDDSEF